MEAVRPLYTIGILFIGVHFILSLFKRRNLEYFTKLIDIKYFFFFLLLFYIFVHSIFQSSREIKDALYLVYWIFILPYIVVCYCFDSKLNLQKFANSIIYFSLFTSIVAFLVFFNVLTLNFGLYELKQNYWTAFRIHGFMGQPTALGGLIGLALIFTSYYKKRVKSIKVFLLIFLFISLLATGSRNAFISLLTVFIFTKLISFKLQNIILIPLIFTVTVILLCFFYFNFNTGYIYHLVNRNDFGGQEDSRLYVWNTVLNLISNNEIIPFIFGNGSGSLAATYRAAFNVPLHIFYDYGLIGFLFYILSFLIPLVLGILKFIKTNNTIFLLGCQLMLYGFTFNMFISSFLSPFFSFHVFTFIFGIYILSLKSKFLYNHTLNTKAILCSRVKLNL